MLKYENLVEDLKSIIETFDTMFDAQTMDSVAADILKERSENNQEDLNVLQPVEKGRIIHQPAQVALEGYMLDVSLPIFWNEDGTGKIVHGDRLAATWADALISGAAALEADPKADAAVVPGAVVKLADGAGPTPETY